MYNHKPENYQCPLCLAAQGIENEDTMIMKQDVVYKNTFMTAFIASLFRPNNPGHVVIIPNKHFENLYDLPDEYASEVQKTAKQIAIAMKQTKPSA